MKRASPICSIALLILATRVLAAPPAPAAPVSEITPFIGSSTVAVLRADLTNLDVAALAAWAKNIQATEKPDKVAMQETQKDLREAQDCVQSFKKAGGQRVYVVFNLSGGPFMVVPLAKGADEKSLTNLVRTGKAEAAAPATQPGHPAQGETAERVGDALVMAPLPMIKRLRTAQPEDRPELSKAFEAAGDSPVSVALIPGESARKMAENMLPTMQNNVSADEIQGITRGMSFGALAVKPPPKGMLQLGLQCKDAESAKAIAATLSKQLAAFKNQARIQHLYEDKGKLADALAPKVAGDKITMSLDAAAIDQLAPPMFRALLRARLQANRIKSASNIRQLLMGCFMVANDKGQWPDDLATLKGQDVPLDELMENPDRSGRKNGYIYVKPVKQPTQDMVVIYEDYDSWDEGINIGFGDGHVEWVTDEATFKKALEAPKSKQ